MTTKQNFVSPLIMLSILHIFIFPLLFLPSVYKVTLIEKLSERKTTTTMKKKCSFSQNISTHSHSHDVSKWGAREHMIHRFVCKNILQVLVQRKKYSDSNRKTYIFGGKPLSDFKISLWGVASTAFSNSPSSQSIRLGSYKNEISF